jgi:hypothetical protein
LLNWAIAYATPYLVNYGEGYANLQSKIFFVWFGCCFLCIAFVYFLVYETKGLSLEEVDEMYADKSVTAWRSASWRPQGSSREEGKGEVAESSSAEVVALEEVGEKRV